MRQELIDDLRLLIAQGRIRPEGLKLEVLVGITEAIIAQGRKNTQVSDKVLGQQLARLADKREKKRVVRIGLEDILRRRLQGG